MPTPEAGPPLRGHQESDGEQGRARDARRSQGRCGCGVGEVVQALVQGSDEAGAALDAAHSALERCGQLVLRLAQDDLGERSGAAVLRHLVGAATDVGGNGAGVSATRTSSSR